MNSDTSQPLPIHTPPKLDAAAEAAARRAHEQVAGLSLNNARRLAQRYGTPALEKGLRQMKQRDDVFNPAGFLVTLLRSEQMFYSPKPRSKSAAEKGADWIEKMAGSDFVTFLANADDFVR